MSDYHKDIQLPSIHTSEEIDQESWYTQAKMLGMWFFFKEKKKKSSIKARQLLLWLPFTFPSCLPQMFEIF